jgi:hypothetical protein
MVFNTAPNDDEVTGQNSPVAPLQVGGDAKSGPCDKSAVAAKSSGAERSEGDAKSLVPLRSASTAPSTPGSFVVSAMVTERVSPPAMLAVASPDASGVPDESRASRCRCIDEPSDAGTSTPKLTAPEESMVALGKLVRSRIRCVEPMTMTTCKELTGVTGGDAVTTT